jgi:2-(1,2-epoxy-1,2-dihydrophenyl)acetyl-CoA isomerase
MNYETILFEVKDQVAMITLNRPEAANGLNMAMGKDLMHAAIRCDEDPEIRAVLLTGRGKFFSAGGDLKFFADFGDGLAKALKEMTVYCHSAASRFTRMDKPLVTAVNGAAAGMGMSFAICGDLVIAAESASFTAAYTAAALAPDGGMTYLLPRYVGLLRARELMLTNRRLGSKEALEWGLVNRVVPDAELMQEAEKLVRALAAGPTLSYGSVKRLLSGTFSQTLETQMEFEARAIVDMSKTADAREGVGAFLARRKPTFTGK